MDFNIDDVITPKQDIYNIEGDIILTRGTPYRIGGGLFEELMYISAENGTDYWIMPDVDGNLFTPVDDPVKQYKRAMGVI